MNNIVICKEKIDKRIKGVQVKGDIYYGNRRIEVTITGYINDETYKVLNASFNDPDSTIYVADYEKRLQMKMFVAVIKSNGVYFRAKLALSEDPEPINLK